MTDDDVYRQLARIGKALSNPLRLRLLDRLELGEHTVDELAEATGTPVKNTSAQLQQLRAAQLVHARRDGTRVHYRVAGPATSQFLGAFADYAKTSLADLRDHLASMHEHPAALELVDVDELDDLMESGDIVLIDVRSADDYARGHVPGAVSIPVADLDERIGELPADGDVIAYCSGPYCVASADAVTVLIAAGRTARRVDGGITSWVRSGRPLDTP
ncbi:ArsR family transcriptional regulator [Gordonia spumicola]|uniref:ArsR family transcriptional regulator n=1 Tax=Gordonia spumicola TaxID=589161 RepID=A0A7I9VAA5_9ACTN|nr:ArsR family transcriptional regulator [Gordonia spumicola]GEE02000.1 ArsR family transcriptional regulator [Gordonia spumicola]